MEILEGNHFDIGRRTAVMLGKFDAMHRGHKLLLDQLLVCKEQGACALAFTFSVPPRALITGEERRLLMTREEKRRFFEDHGIDILVEYTFDDAARHMSPEAFVRDVLCGQLHAGHVIVGEDFRFGYQRSGDTDLLRRMSSEYSYELCVIPELLDSHGEEISATHILEYVARGEMEEAEELLGRPFSYAGLVGHGAGLGHTFGIPTVNIALPPEKIVPPYGVYAGTVKFDGRTFAAVSNIGVKPTVTDAGMAGLEAFILDFSGDLYEKQIEVTLRHYLRPEKRFDDIEALKAQILRDIEKTRGFGYKSDNY